MSHCPSCGAEVAPDQKFCLDCGTCRPEYDLTIAPSWQRRRVESSLISERVTLLARLDEVAPIEQQTEVVT